MKYERITINKNKMNGIACIRDLRVPVASILAMLGSGMSLNEILEDFPYLEPEDIEQALKFASDSLTLAEERELKSA